METHIMIIPLFLLFSVGDTTFPNSFDSASIKQTVFVSVNSRLGLVTNDVEIYTSVVHGSLEEIEKLKPIEFNKALQRRRPIVIVKANCR